MRAISQRRVAGFTMIETMIGLLIVSLALAFGLPMITNWTRSAKIKGSSEFYNEGFQRARAEAIKHKSAARISLNAGANGQMDWQVDICFPTNGVVCNNQGGGWSTVGTAAARDPEGAANGFRSIFTSASALPNQNILRQTIAPPGTNQIYYTPLGWVDTTIPARMTALTLGPVSGTGYDFEPVAMMVTLSGMVNKCLPDPALAAADSRRCPQ